MRIGEVAKRSGFSIRVIRHYDSLGLLRASRDENKYRSFTMDDVESARLIQLFLSIGFRLREIRDYAPYWQKNSPTSLRDAPREQSIQFLQGRLSEIDERMHRMLAIRSRLEDHLQADCADLAPAQECTEQRLIKKVRRRE
jgi:DNA-binding transcriptional MerR regulator